VVDANANANANVSQQHTKTVYKKEPKDDTRDDDRIATVSFCFCPERILLVL